MFCNDSLQKILFFTIDYFFTMGSFLLFRIDYFIHLFYNGLVSFLFSFLFCSLLCSFALFCSSLSLLLLCSLLFVFFSFISFHHQFTSSLSFLTQNTSQLPIPASLASNTQHTAHTAPSSVPYSAVPRKYAMQSKMNCVYGQHGEQPLALLLAEQCPFQNMHSGHVAAQMYLRIRVQRNVSICVQSQVG